MIKTILELFIKEVVEESIKNAVKVQALKQLGESTRVEFLKIVAEGFTKEVSHNLSGYAKSLGAINVEVSSDNSGERLFLSLQSALKSLEVELEKQGEGSPIVNYLRSRYGEKRESLVGRPVRPIYSLYTPKSVDPTRPWLNRTETASPNIGEFLAQEASRLLENLLSSNQNT